MGTHFSYAIIAVVSFMQGDYASLDFLFLLYHDKRNRGFAAYEARQGGVVGMIKRGFCLRLFAGRHLPLKRKGSKRFGLILCNLTHKPIHKIQQTQAWPT